MNQYPGVPQQFNGFGQPQYPQGMYPTQPQYPGMPQGYPQGYPQGGYNVGMPPVAPNPYMQQMPNQFAVPQGYQYPQVAGNGITPATNMPMNAPQGSSMGGVGSIYTGDVAAPSNVPPALQQHMTPSSAQPPQGASYPQWFTQYTNIPVNQLENCVRQTLNTKLTRAMEKLATNGFNKYVTPNGIDQNFVSTALANARRVAQIIILQKAKGTMVEAVNLAVDIVIYGCLVLEIGGIDSPAIASFEMITGVNLRECFAEYREMVLDQQAYMRVVTACQQKLQEALSVVKTQQQNLANAYQPQQPVSQPQQGLAAIVVNTGGAMIDPMDQLAQEAYDKKLAQIAAQQEAAKAQQEIIMNIKTGNPNDPWNLGLVENTTPTTETAAPAEVVEQAPAKLYDEYLRVTNLTYLKGVKHHPRFATLKDGTKIQSLFEPVPLDPMDFDLFYKAEDQYLADMEVHYAKKKLEQQQREEVAKKAAEQVTTDPVEQSVAADTWIETFQTTPPAASEVQPKSQPAVHTPTAPAVTPNVDVPPVASIGHVVGQHRREQEVLEAETPQGGVIQTTRNGGVIPSSSIAGFDPNNVPAPTNYFSYGLGSTEQNLSPATTVTGELEQEDEDAFNRLVHEAEAQEAYDSANNFAGVPPTTDEILNVAREMGIQVEEPELRVDYLGMDATSRKRVCRDLHIRKVPAYLKKQHNLTLVTRGSQRSVVAEKVESVEYIKHETEHHQVPQYDSWNTSETNEELYIGHITAASEKVWSEETFANKLNEKLEGIVNSDDRDKKVMEVIAERPLVEIEDLISNMNISDEYQSEITDELVARGVEDVGHIVENAVISYKRLTTNRLILDGEDLELFRAVHSATTASSIIETLYILKQNVTIPIREVARLVKVFQNHVNCKLRTLFANGWGVTDVLADYDELVDALINAYPNMSIADIQSTLTSIYVDARNTTLHLTDVASDAMTPTQVVGNLEAIILLPFQYRDYPIAKADEVGYLDPELFPEMVKFLNVATTGYSVIKLVTLDNVVITFTTGGEGEYFVTAVDE